MLGSSSNGTEEADKNFGNALVDGLVGGLGDNHDRDRIEYGATMKTLVLRGLKRVILLKSRKIELDWSDEQ